MKFIIKSYQAFVGIGIYNEGLVLVTFQIVCLGGRAGHLGFAVLQWSSKSYFVAILIIKMAYFWARLVIFQRVGPIKI